MQEAAASHPTHTHTHTRAHTPDRYRGMVRMLSRVADGTSPLSSFLLHDNRFQVIFGTEEKVGCISILPGSGSSLKDQRQQGAWHHCN